MLAASFGARIRRRAHQLSAGSDEPNVALQRLREQEINIIALVPGRGRPMISLIPPELLWLSVGFIMLMACMLAASQAE
jgi:hypothetical protein